MRRSPGSAALAKRLLWLLVFGATFFAATLIVIASLQTQMLFPTNMVWAPGPLPPGARQVQTVAADGTELHGVQIPATTSKGDRTLVLGFGGNAWNGSDVAVYLHELFPQAEVVAFHYRGYKPSKGSPSAKALIADAPLVHDFAVHLVKPKRVIVAGMSIGSGIAASLAVQRKLDGLILVTPFDSLKAAAADLYPWLPIGPFFEHEIDAAAFLEGSRVPVAILAAEQDSLIKPARTAALRARLKNPVYEFIAPRAGHNDIYQRDDFRKAMREAFDRLNAYKA